MATLQYLLINTFDRLTEEELRRFKSKLADIPHGRNYRGIPRGMLENRDRIGLAEKMISTYGEYRAVEVACDVLRDIGLQGHAEELHRRMPSSRKRKQSDSASDQVDGRKKKRIGEERNEKLRDYSLSEMEIQEKYRAGGRRNIS
ncbi:apoptosis-associated speck-like protein containing a CARD [Latimeria chalumnae]|uniref:apoptosis-associated speck-like protein containing a CARD n=1 Tax=Latimeria chalumnae TaxID=7897 RepID=UPI00313C2AED